MIDPFVEASDAAMKIVRERGMCRFTQFGELVGVIWLSPRGQLRSWWLPIDRLPTGP